MLTPNGFEIKLILLAYVPPHVELEEDEEKTELRTRVLKGSNKTTDYLLKIFDSSIDVCNVEIAFKSDGKQENAVRSDILKFLAGDKNTQKVKAGKNLAEKLYAVTDERNGTGLLVIIEGKKQKTTRIILCRFKGDEGLSNHGEKLDLEYIPELFTKKSKHYKLVVFEDVYSAKSFWKGYAIDKQVSGNTYKPLTTFWVEDFLQAQSAITSIQGTVQFSKIIKSILSAANNITEEEEIISGVINLKNKRSDYQLSVSEFCKQYLSQELAERIKSETGSDFFNSVFQIDKEVFQKEFGSTVLSLQDGIVAFVPTFQYDKHVKEEVNKDGSKKIIIEAQLKNKKINVRRQEKLEANEDR